MAGFQAGREYLVYAMVDSSSRKVGVFTTSTDKFIETSDKPVAINVNTGQGSRNAGKNYCASFFTDYARRGQSNSQSPLDPDVKVWFDDMIASNRMPVIEACWSDYPKNRDEVIAAKAAAVQKFSSAGYKVLIGYL
jgi:hypothetical protein